MKNYQKILLGKHNGENIYLTPPSWDCGWYWGFGYLGNNNRHYHVDGLKKSETYNFEKKVFEYKFMNLYDGFIEHFGDTLMVRKSHLWKLCELFETFYRFKEMAEVYDRGGCHYTNNPCKDLIENKDEAKKINEVILPAVFEEIYKILESGQTTKEDIKEVVRLFNEGDTTKTVKYMLEVGLTMDDLKDQKKISYNDYHTIHKYYFNEKR